MKISVVIPLFNKEKTILRAINSVLNQSEQDFEIIVVNDGSTDKSAELVAAIDDEKRIRLINQKNMGVSAARNRGVAEARLDLIAFLDADDEWMPDYLKTILELRAQFPDGDVYCTLYRIQGTDGRITTPATKPFFDENFSGYIDNYLEVLLRVLPFNMASFSVTKSSYQEVGGFTEGINYGEDVDLFIRLSLSHKIVFANRPLAIYHRDAEDRACDQFEQEGLQDYYPVSNLVKMVEKGEVPAKLMQSAIEFAAKHQLNFAKTFLHYGNPDKAREFIKSCKGTKIYQVQWIMLYMETYIPAKFYTFLIKMKQGLQG